MASKFYESRGSTLSGASTGCFALFLKTDPICYVYVQRYERLDYYYKRIWRLAEKLGIGKIVKFVGNRIFPKSDYFYCERL
jgi:hypothetical protein